MLGVLKKGWGVFGPTDTHRRRTPREDDGRDQGDASAARECQGLPADSQQLGETRQEQVLPCTFPTEPTLPRPWFLLPASRTGGQYTSVVPGTPSVVLCHDSPSQLTG